ncbi:hypothetical protein O181_055636 [Austropuccinia psidii MF-1]|uniref:CCHC-type domain-containing protein n=1 Tax=Austropuccinia psidii MF-1 TaxID=1389203 RepID=A0A9Q3HS82_9BASI|nr:hypothetical protein [Austropuccinia psidii MF-1]
MEDIITRTRIVKTWNGKPIESKIAPKTSKEDRRPEKPFLKCHRCGSTSHLANNCTKNTRIKEVQVVEEVHCSEEKEESDQDSEIPEDKTKADYPIENITALCEVTEVPTHLPPYSEECYNLSHFQEAMM